MFNFTDKYTLPKLTDLINMSDINNMDWFGVTTYLWIELFGTWFFAMVIGVIGAGIYIKYDNVMFTMVYFLVFGLLLSQVLPFMFLTIIGIFGGFAVGILLYQVFISKNE